MFDQVLFIPDPIRFRRALLSWYRAHRRVLPWRSGRDPYQVWISEVMLQQTTVQAVIPYFNKWMRAFPDLPALARAPRSRVMKIWQGLGYYQRARNLHEAARQIMRRHGGSIPNDLQEARALPGFGPYTAAAVLSIAYRAPHAVLDANVRRLMMRLHRIHGTARPALDTSLRKELDRLLPKRNPGDFNQAMMELGALVCRPRQPRCTLCPLRENCRAFEAGEQEIIPEPRTREYTRIQAAVGVLLHEGRFFLQKRPPGGLLGDLWEFPGGKLEPGENAESALRREIREELGIDPGPARFLTRIRHDYTRFRVTLHAYLCRPETASRLPSGRGRWVKPGALRRYPVPSGTARLIHFLEENPQAWKKDRGMENEIKST